MRYEKQYSKCIILFTSCIVRMFWDSYRYEQLFTTNTINCIARRGPVVMFQFFARAAAGARTHDIAQQWTFSVSGNP